MRNATRQEVIDSLVQAYNELGEPFTGERYRLWVGGKAAEHGGGNAPFRLPSVGTVTRVTGGTWGKAVIEILGDRGDARTAARRRGRRFPDAELRRAWWTCRSTIGRAPSIREYELWRHNDPAPQGYRTAPSEGTIRSRYPRRTWQSICDMFETEGPPTDQEQPDG